MLHREITLGASYALLLDANALPSIPRRVEIQASADNAGEVYMEGDDGSDVPWKPNDYRIVNGLHLQTIKFRGVGSVILTEVEDV